MEWQSILRTCFEKLILQLSQCDLCGNNTHTKTNKHALLCSSCLASLPLFKQDIIQGDLLNWPAINRALPNISFDHLFSLSPYLPPFNGWLAEFKYQGRFELANTFADLLLEQWQKSSSYKTVPKIDLVLSVPLHIHKWQTRGYNQAHLIARRFAKKTQLPYQASTLKRIKKNISQVGKTGAQRRKNLADAFALKPNLVQNVRHVMLIDDVVTTGSTANEISKLLKSAGVDKVTLVTVCLSLPSV